MTTQSPPTTVTPVVPVRKAKKTFGQKLFSAGLILFVLGTALSIWSKIHPVASSSGLPTPTASSTWTSAYSASGDGASSSTDAVYLSVVRSLLPADSDFQLMGIGTAVCGALDSGADYGTVLRATMTDSSLDAFQAGELVDTAVITYCPSDESMVP